MAPEPPVKYVVRSARPPGRPLDLEAELNPEQRAVVVAEGGPMLVIAGAGSGKTRALTYRVAWLLAHGVRPDRLLLCTFTNRAAREMLRRVEALTGVETRALFAGTFHHVAHRLLRQYRDRVGLPAGFGILDREDARELLAACLAEEGVRDQRLPQPKVLMALLSRAINSSMSVADAVAHDAPRFVEAAAAIARVADCFAARKAAMGMVDFDDLLLLWKALLVDHPDAAAELRTRFEHVLCDEYQDTSRIQGELVDLCAAGHRNLMVVGDDAQSIYSFRGADFRNILEFPARYPDARVYKLETSYRSTPEIIALANQCIAHNAAQHPKVLRPVCAPGDPPAVVPLADVYQQAEFVAQRLLELHQLEGVPLREIAVLYRNHAHALELQVELTRRKIPYVVRSGLRFFEQAHIKDVVAYLRVLANARDGLAWSRVLKLYGGVGARSARRVADGAARQDGPADLVLAALAPELPGSARAPVGRLAALLARLREPPEGPAAAIARVVAGHYAEYAAGAFPNADARLEDLRQLADYAARFADVPAFLADLSLVAGIAAETVLQGEPPEEHLTLSTIHQAKGLEWTAVFVLWLADGRFPNLQALRTQEEEEEERRLFYVAVTRTRRHLFLCYPQRAEDARGLRTILRPSRFITELDGPAPPFERWAIETAPG
ncbi:MAG TPA: ATP-dependent helicase [Polyangia bacterium]|jgi:DNA helicase-2/ATP-dependent DNA helicase PcrA